MADQYYKYVSLLLPFDGADASTTFEDRSLTPSSVTANGNAQIDTAQSKFGGSSGLFDGTGDYLSLPNSSDFTFPENFTVEAWVRPNSLSGFFPILNIGDYSLATGFLFYVGTDGSLRVFANGGLVCNSSASLISTGTWYHVAAVRSGTSFKLYIDGTEVASATFSASVTSTATNYIGADYDAGITTYANGWIDDLRVTKGIARYTAAFTAPAAAFDEVGPEDIDLYYNDVSLLLDFAGADASTTFTDLSGIAKTVSVAGNAQVDTAQSRYGGSSLYLDGAGDYIHAPADEVMGSLTHDQPITIECWVRPEALAANGEIWSTRTDNGAVPAGVTLRLEADNTLRVYGYDFLGSSTLRIDANSTGTCPDNIWTHVAVTRDDAAGGSGTWKIYINGVEDGSATETGTLKSDGATNEFKIGANYSVEYYKGWIDDFRVTHGVVRYTTTFTPPVNEFATAAPAIPVDPHFEKVALLLDFAGADASTTFTDLSGDPVTVTASGTAQIDTADSRFGGTSGLFDGNLDYLLVGSSAAITGTGNFTLEFWANFDATDTRIIYDQRPNGTSSGAYPALYTNGGTLRYFVNGLDRITSSSISTGTWYHIALCRNSGTTTLYIDGASQGSWADSTNYINGASRPVIGQAGDGITTANLGFDGWLDDFRITLGIARYTTDFQRPSLPSATEGGDPYWDKVALSLPMDGADASTTFTDVSSSPVTVTANGNAQIDTAQSKFGGSSALFDGTGDYLSMPRTDAGFPGASTVYSEPFTVEAWIRPNSLAATSTMFGTRYDSPGTSGWALRLNTTGSVQIIGWDTVSLNVNITSSTGLIVVNTWHHVALVFDGTNWTAYVNGVQAATDTGQVRESATASNNFCFGAKGDGGETYNGWIDDARVTQGVARYTAAFTPPVAPFSTQSVGTLWDIGEIDSDLWLDADDATTITESAGAVSAWADKSPFGRNASQGTGSLQPSLITAGQNGKDLIRFDGTDDGFDLVNFAQTSGQTILMAGESDVGTAFRQFLGRSSGAASNMAVLLGGNPDNYKPCFYWNSGNRAVQAADRRATPALFMWNFNASATPNTTTEFNAQNQVTENFTVGGLTNWNMIGDTSGTQDPDMDVYEIVMLRPGHSAEDQDKAEGYLAWKWGLESSLPSTHPYRYSPPVALLASDTTHVLTATSVEAASEVSTPTLAIPADHILTATSVQSASEVSVPTATHNFDELLADDVQSASQVSAPVLAILTEFGPTVTNQPDDTVITMPNSGSLVTAANGIYGHSVTVQWYDASTDLPLSNGSVYSGVTTGTLTITSPTFADNNGDQFYAIWTDVSNGLTTQTNTATLTVAPSVDNGSTTVKPFRTFTAGVVPTTSNLEEGELAMNVVDGKLFSRDDSNNIVTLGGLYDGASLPTSDPAVVGALWNDNGTVKISNG